MRTMRNGISRKAVRAGLAVAAAATFAVAGLAAPAQANDFDGTCNDEEICLYYYGNFTGARADFYYDVSNYSGRHFWNSSSWLDNNAASAKNTDEWWNLNVWDFSGYGGPTIEIEDETGKSCAQLGSLCNHISSHEW